jgi:CRISPR/Cas system-associated protein Cas10 (large subunit of type III CRISPR-Cas system)
VEELLVRIAEYETEWANTDFEVQDAALDAVGADTIDDVVAMWPNMDEDQLDDAAWLWKDFMGVVRHKEHEMGLR